MELLNKMAKLFAVFLMTLILVACGGAEDRKAKHLELGKTLFDAGNYEKARLEFKNVLQIDPKDIEARYRLAQVLEKLQNWRPAAGNYQSVIDSDPTHVGARVRLGNLYLLSKVVDKAMELAEEALKIESNNPDALALRGNTRAQSGDPEGAMQDAQAALQADPGHAAAIGLVASLYVQNKQVDKAIAWLVDGIAKNPEHTGLRNLLARIYAGQGDNDRAAEQLKAIITAQPDQMAHRVRLASFYSQIKQLDEAEKVFHEGVAHNPDSTNMKLALVQFLATRRDKALAEKELLAYIQREPEVYPLRFGLTKLYEAAGETNKAKGVYRKIIELNDTGPQGLKARNQLALLFAKEKNLDEAEALVAEVLDENPRDSDALVVRGELALAKKDPLRAIADFRTVLTDQPNSTKLLRLLAKAHMRNNEPALAQENLQKAVKANPQDFESRFEYAQLLAQSGETNRVIVQIQEALKISPSHIGALEVLVKLQMAKRDWIAAQVSTEQIKTAHPDQPLGYYYAGLIDQAQQKFEPSIQAFEQALQKAPDAVQPLAALVKSYLAQNQPDKALARLNQVLKETPDNFSAYNLMGNVYLFQKQYDPAEAAFRKTMALHPQSIIPYRNLAAVHLVQDDTAGAIQAYKAGLEATAGAPALMFGLASLYEQQGDSDLAIAQYEALLDKEPDSQPAANNLAMMLASTPKGDQESLERAKELAERFKASKNPAYLDTLGWVHYKRGEIDTALPILERAVEKAPKAPVINYHFGMALYSKGNRELARQHLEQALQSKVNFPGVDDAKATLETLAGS